MKISQLWITPPHTHFHTHVTLVPALRNTTGRKRTGCNTMAPDGSKELGGSLCDVISPSSTISNIGVIAVFNYKVTQLFPIWRYLLSTQHFIAVNANMRERKRKEAWELTNNQMVHQRDTHPRRTLLTCQFLKTHQRPTEVSLYLLYINYFYYVSVTSFHETTASYFLESSHLL